MFDLMNNFSLIVFNRGVQRTARWRQPPEAQCWQNQWVYGGLLHLQPNWTEDLHNNRSFKVGHPRLVPAIRYPSKCDILSKSPLLFLSYGVDHPEKYFLQNILMSQWGLTLKFLKKNVMTLLFHSIRHLCINSFCLNSSWVNSRWQ